MELAILAILAFMVVCFTIASYVKRIKMLAIVSSGVWALFGFQALGYSDASSVTEITDVYMGLFWLGMGMTIACILEAVFMKSTTEKDEDKDDIKLDDIDRFNKEAEELEMGMRLPRLPSAARANRRVNKGDIKWRKN